MRLEYYRDCELSRGEETQRAWVALRWSFVGQRLIVASEPGWTVVQNFNVALIDMEPPPPFTPWEP